MDDARGQMKDFSEVMNDWERSQSEIENSLGNAAETVGRSLGRSAVAALGRVAALRREPMPQRVKKMFAPGGRYEKHGDAVRPVMAAMRPQWWSAREKQNPDEIARTLIGYADERAERAAKRAAREDEKAARAREVRPSPTDIMSAAGWLTVPVDEKTLSVVEKSVELYSCPERRPPSAWPEVRIKEWEKLSKSSQDVYKRSIVQTKEELKQLQARTPWDIVSYLTGKAETRSRAVYNRHRATVIQMARAGGNAELENVIRSMPPYKMICDMLGVKNTPRVGEITRARRKQKDEKTWEALQLQLSPLYRDCVRALRTTGARVGELSSLSLREGGDGGMVATLQTSKIGARRRGDTPPTREISFRAGTPESDFLRELMTERGETPFQAVEPSQLRSAWGRARTAAGVEDGQTWCLHALRHAYAGKRKEEIHKNMVEKHGADWRRKLDGNDWQNNEKYRPEVYGELARELGHSNEEMVKIYG